MPRQPYRTQNTLLRGSWFAVLVAAGIGYTTLAAQQPDAAPGQRPKPGVAEATLCDSASDETSSASRPVLTAGSAIEILRGWDPPDEWSIGSAEDGSRNYVPLMLKAARGDGTSRFVICVTETRMLVGTYTSGSRAYRIRANVRIVDRSTGGVVARMSGLTDGPPPPSISVTVIPGSKPTSSPRPVYGVFPYDSIRTWINEFVNDPKLLKHSGEVYSAAFSADGRRLISFVANTQSLHVWDTASHQHTRVSTTVEWKHGDEVFRCLASYGQVRISSDGEYAAVKGGAGDPAKSCVVMWALSPSPMPLWVQRFEPTAGTSDRESSLKLRALVFTPTGRELILGFSDGTMIFVDAKNGEIRTRVRAWNKAIEDLVAVDDTRVAIGGCSGLIVLNRSGRLERTLLDPRIAIPDCARPLSYSAATGELAAVTDPSVTVFSLGKRSPSRQVVPANANAQKAVFSRDGSRLAVQVWDNAAFGHATRIYDARGKLISERRGLFLSDGTPGALAMYSGHLIELAGFE